MSRRRYVCRPGIEHVNRCWSLPGVVDDECGCGCDVTATCVEWQNYVGAMMPEEEKPVRRRKRKPGCSR